MRIRLERDAGIDTIAGCGVGPKHGDLDVQRLDGHAKVRLGKLPEVRGHRVVPGRDLVQAHLSSFPRRAAAQ